MNRINEYGVVGPRKSTDPKLRDFCVETVEDDWRWYEVSPVPSRYNCWKSSRKYCAELQKGSL